MRSTWIRRAQRATYTLAAAGAIAITALGFAPSAKACGPEPTPVQTQVSAPTTYTFATDETAAGDLDVPWQDNADAEADDSACELTPLSESAYGPEVYLVTCTYYA